MKISIILGISLLALGIQSAAHAFDGEKNKYTTTHQNHVERQKPVSVFHEPPTRRYSRDGRVHTVSTQRYPRAMAHPQTIRKDGRVYTNYPHAYTKPVSYHPESPMRNSGVRKNCIVVEHPVNTGNFSNLSKAIARTYRSPSQTTHSYGHARIAANHQPR